MFPWLQPDKRRDASGRRPSDPEYDPVTLQLPGAFPKCKDATGKPFTVSPGQAQWWRFKAALRQRHHVQDGQVLRALLRWTRLKIRRRPPSPPAVRTAALRIPGEANYATRRMAPRSAGHGVVVVERRLTRAARRRKAATSRSSDNVDTREKVAVLTRGGRRWSTSRAASASPARAVAAAILEVEDKTSSGARPRKTDASRSPRATTFDDETGGTWMGVCAPTAPPANPLLLGHVTPLCSPAAFAASRALKPVEIVCAPCSSKHDRQGDADARHATPDASDVDPVPGRPRVPLRRGRRAADGRGGILRRGRRASRATATFGASTVRGERAACTARGSA